MNSATIHFDNASEARDIGEALGPLVSKIEQEHGLQLVVRDLKISVSGPEEPVRTIGTFIEQLRGVRNRTRLDVHSTRYVYDAYSRGETGVFEALASMQIDVSPKKAPIYPKTLGQRIYLKAIAENAITFGIGPAGTGKTYLAMAMAVSALLREEVGRIILARPAIEAGEYLGFLPGDMQQKVFPYLRPLYDALYDMLPPDAIDGYIARGVIEVAPLAYMRGRTLNHAFVILDEAQNTTPQQMLMFLTRLGFDSKCAITGDITQIDLPNRNASGLIEARNILRKIPGLEFIELTEKDVVRHPLVQKVIEAYRQKRTS